MIFLNFMGRRPPIWSLAGRSRWPMKSQIIESRWYPILKKMLCHQSYKRTWTRLFKSFPSLSTTDGFRDLDNCVASVKLLISRLIDLSSSSSGSTKSSISEDKSTSSR